MAIELLAKPVETGKRADFLIPDEPLPDPDDLVIEMIDRTREIICPQYPEITDEVLGNMEEEKQEAWRLFCSLLPRLLISLAQKLNRELRIRPPAPQKDDPLSFEYNREEDELQLCFKGPDEQKKVLQKIKTSEFLEFFQDYFSLKWVLDPNKYFEVVRGAVMKALKMRLESDVRGEQFLHLQLFIDLIEPLRDWEQERLGRKILYPQTLSWYENNAERYAKNIPQTIPPEIEEFEKELPRNCRIADIGCAAGRDTAYFTGKRHKSIGLDRIKEFLKIAKGKHKEIQFAQGDILKLPFEDNSLDAVCVRSVLLHLPTPDLILQALRECHRALKPNGLGFFRVKKKKERESKFEMNNGRLFQYFTEEEFRDLMEQAGFEITKLYESPDDADESRTCFNVVVRKKM